LKIKTLKAGRQLIDFIKVCHAANTPPLLMGAHGIGKSQILEQAAAELEIDYCCRDLSLMEPPDLVGMPKLEGKTTQFLPPDFLPTSGKGLLVFEELNRCPSYMRAPCLQLLTARTLNDYRLPAGWLPVAAINPPNGEYDVHELDPALLSRFVQINLVPDRKEWIAWAERVGVHPDVCNYVTSDPTIFNDTNPRSWKYVSDFLLVCDGTGAKGIVEAGIAGFVGAEREMAFRTFRKTGFAPPAAKEVLVHYELHQARVREWTTTGKLDVLEAVITDIRLHLQDPNGNADVMNSKSQQRNLSAFAADLPPDLARSLMHRIQQDGLDGLCEAVFSPRRSRRTP
jgi:AAA domain (dynein-related subfamily)